LRIGAFTLSPRAAYIEATLSQLERYPGLGVTVHDVLTDGRHTVVRLSEHGPSARHSGAAAAWRVIAVFEHAGDGIVRSWAEEDYWGRRRQLSDGAPDSVDRAAVAPWSTSAEAPQAGVAEAVREWLAAGAPVAEGVIRDDADLVEHYDLPFTATAGSVDVLVVSGRRVGFHGVVEAAAGDTSLQLPVAGLVEVGVDGAILVSPFMLYRYDASYTVQAQRAHPGRFAIVKPVDPTELMAKIQAFG